MICPEEGISCFLSHLQRNLNVLTERSVKLEGGLVIPCCRHDAPAAHGKLHLEQQVCNKVPK